MFRNIDRCDRRYQASESVYTDLMYENGIKEEEEDVREVQTITAPITKIAQGVVEGNSHYYIMVEGSDDIFDVSVVDFIDIIRYNVGDQVTIEYKEARCIIRFCQLMK